MKRSKAYEKRKLSVSKTAQKTLALIESGRFYPDNFLNNKPVIKELITAGLIKPTMRVVTIERCFVPTSGYKPCKPEEFA